jgi:hypothetical protein
LVVVQEVEGRAFLVTIQIQVGLDLDLRAQKLLEDQLPDLEFVLGNLVALGRIIAWVR